MKTYQVLSNVSYGKADASGKIIVKPKDYKAGEKIELDDEDAKPLLEAGAIAASDEKKK